MRSLILPLALAAGMLALPAAAAETGDQQSSSGGVFDWLMDTIGGSQSADQALDEKKEPAKTDEENTAGESRPMPIPDDGASDKDSYKPDAGDAPQ